MQIILSLTVNDQFLHQHFVNQQDIEMGIRQTPSLLDLVLTNKEEGTSEMEIGPPLGKSDHVTLFQMTVESQNEEEVLTRNYYQADYDKMSWKLREVDCEQELLDRAQGRIQKFQNVGGSEGGAPGRSTEQQMGVWGSSSRKFFEKIILGNAVSCVFGRFL